MKQNVAKNNLMFLPACLSLFALIACGESKEKIPSTSPAADAQETASERRYTGAMEVMNSSLVTGVSGEAMLELKEAEMVAEIRMNGVSETSHRQYLFQGACPGMAADTNQDGLIDGQEARGSIGAMAIALDDNLSNGAEMGEFPSGDASGSYFYSQTGTRVDLSEFSVMVMGVGEDVTLPETVVAGEGEDARADFPIACASLLEERQDTEDNGGEDEGPILPGPTPDQGQDQGQDQTQDQGQQQQKKQQTQRQQNQKGSKDQWQDMTKL